MGALVIVEDYPHPLPIEYRRPTGPAQIDRERLVPLHPRVPHHVHRHRLARLPWRERQ